MNRYGFLRRVRPRTSSARDGSPVRARGRLDLAALRELWGRSVFTVLDFETTGLDPREDRICEIGAVRLALTGAESASLDLLVNPGRPIRPEASRVSGITDEMVRDAPAVEDALPDLLAFLGDSVIVAHNASFDLGFLAAAARRAGLSAPSNPVADTRDLAREAFPGLPSYALQRLAGSFGLAPGNAHRACDDARTCARLLVLCAQAASGIPAGDAESESPGTP